MQELGKEDLQLIQKQTQAFMRTRAGKFIVQWIEQAERLAVTAAISSGDDRERLRALDRLSGIKALKTELFDVILGVKFD